MAVERTIEPPKQTTLPGIVRFVPSAAIQARGALNKELLQHLSRTRGMRRSRHHTQKTDVHGQIVGAVSISERPASAEDRAVPGHWKVI